VSVENHNSLLLDRNSFRNGVFERDGYKCVICGKKGTNHPGIIEANSMHTKRLAKILCDIAGVKLDAHHIIERRLWDDGGYYLDNGATLCDAMEAGCHMKAEQTVLTCDEIRTAAGIRRIIIPDHLYADYNYDKWGNIINPDGTRTKGELFNDESVQQVLLSGGMLERFRTYVKYPRTYHLPWSPGLTDDDRKLPTTTVFEGREVVITEKMDGENTTLYRDYMHARSLEEEHHESRGWVKKLHAEICYGIPEGWRVVGENLFAKHSIGYNDLSSYFMVFSIWDQNNFCMSWDDTVDYAGVLGLQMVPVIYRGIWNESYVRSLEKSIDTQVQEGYTVRLTDSFAYGSFRKSIAKWVRQGHVQTTHNWKMRSVVKNGLKISP
jgi:RNA ligase-like protein